MGTLREKNLQKEYFNTHQTEEFVYGQNIPYARYMVGKILEHIQKKSNRVLEIGAGQGRFTFELARHIPHVVAIDIAERAITILKQEIKQRKLYSVSAVACDVLEIEKILPKGQFNAIVGIHILHHLPKDKLSSVIRQLKKFLAPGGYFCFLEPNSLYPFYLVAMLVQPNMTWEYEKGIYTNFLGVFKRACEAQGLRVTGIRKFGFFPPKIINRWPWITKAGSVIEHIPLIRDILCPFVVIAARKSL